MSQKTVILGAMFNLAACTGLYPSDAASTHQHSSTAIPASNDAPTYSTSSPQTCAGAMDGTACDDGDACTGNAACRQGICVGTPLPGPCGKTLPVVPLKGSAYYLYTLSATVGGSGPSQGTVPK